MPQHDPRIDAYIARQADFARPILEYVRAVVHEACPTVEETLKWSAPSFIHAGGILCGMAAFKQHATFRLWQGTQIVGAGTGKQDDAMGQFGRITRIADLPVKRELAGYIKQAMQSVEQGVKRPASRGGTPKPPVEVPTDLAVALGANAGARATFEAFPASCRREYVEWITEAKREETRAKRLAQTIEWLAEGKRRNWKYENC
jgi:uncharacterized protein YdeI (YjbR/CyaY-like superfamily)